MKVGDSKSLSDQVSNTEIDAIYEKGIRNGALGGKLLGAGEVDFFSFMSPLLIKKSLDMHLMICMKCLFV